MLAEVYDRSGFKLYGLAKIDPVCGTWCDQCGDCLHCYGNVCEDGCRYVIYAESESAAQALLAGNPLEDKP